MIEKLAAAFVKLKREVSDLARRVESLPTPKDGKDADHQAIVRDVLAGIPTPKDGRDADDQAIVRDVLAQIPTPKDGASPAIEDIVALVLKRVPTPKDGKDADHQAIVRDVLAQIPTPKDGRDAQPPLLSDVVEVLMARLPKPKDGKDGVSPTPQAVAQAMPAAKAGKNGVSITDVKLDKNTLFVWLDGVKKQVGKIELPTVAPFQSGGGGSRKIQSLVGYTPQGNFISEVTQAGLLDTPKTVTFGVGGTTANGGITVGANGVLTVNKEFYWSIKQRFRAGRSGASGVSDLYFWAEISTDGGTTWNVIGNSVSIPLASSTDTLVFFDLADGQFPVGTKLRNRFARSSTGNDSGDLRTGMPSAALLALGVPDAPSAQITLYSVNQ